MSDGVGEIDDTTVRFETSAIEDGLYLVAGAVKRVADKIEEIQAN